MHGNQHHRMVRHHGGGGGGDRSSRRLGALEAVALGIVFIGGVSFGAYLEGRQHHDELQSFASPKSMALLGRQQDPAWACDAQVEQATAERDETWKALVRQLQQENEACTKRVTKLIIPEQIPADCLDRLKPKLDPKVYAPAQREREAKELAETVKAAKDADAAEKRKAEAAAAAPSGAGAGDEAACQAGERLQALQRETGYQVLASLEPDPVIDAFLSHMIPYENKNMKMKALLVGNRVGHHGDVKMVAEAIPFEDTLKCHTLDLVMTPKDAGACTLLLPMDRQTTSRSIYRHERYESPGDSSGGKGGGVRWRPAAKASKEGALYVQSYHRVPAEQALLQLFQHLPEIESQVRSILEDMTTATDADAADDDDDDEGATTKARTKTKTKRKAKAQDAAAAAAAVPAPARRFVKVMILNAGNVAMFLNMVCSARHSADLDFKQDLLIFAADAGVEATLQGLGYRTYRHQAFGNFSPAEHMAYGDQQFLHMMWLKTVAGWLVNRLDYDLLYLDSDLIYRKDTGALFQDPDVDIFMQDDGARSERFGPYFGNTGFFYVRANDRTKHLMQMVLFSYELVLAWRSHQAVFTYVMEDVYARNLLRVKIIPLDLLPSGKIYHHRKETMKELVDGKRDFYMFHMNWALHNQDKIRYYRELGWWYIDEACNVGSDPLPASVAKVEDCCVAPQPVEWPPKPPAEEEKKEGKEKKNTKRQLR